MARWKERLPVFLFPTETDLWLGLLRIGLGLQVLLYALSLRADWNYLFAGPGEGLIGRALPEALLSTESPLVPRLGWIVTLTTRTGLSESTALSIVWWILLFAVLPFGVESQHETADVVPGSDPGAPVAPRLAAKALWTTGLSLIAFVALMWLISAMA